MVADLLTVTVFNEWLHLHTQRRHKTSQHIHQPFHLSAPENVLLLVHVDREVLVLALLDGIGPGGDGPHLVELTTKRNKRDIRNICQSKPKRSIPKQTG